MTVLTVGQIIAGITVLAVMAEENFLIALNVNPESQPAKDVFAKQIKAVASGLFAIRKI